MQEWDGRPQSIVALGMANPSADDIMKLTTMASYANYPYSVLHTVTPV